MIVTRRTAAIVLVLALLNAGCHVRKVERVAPADVPQPEREQIVGITTVKGEDVTFDPPGATVKDNMVTGSVKKAPYAIPINQVQRFWVMRKTLSTARTIGLVAAVAVGTVVLIVGIAAATKQSCPFVYSWDGMNYVFDAEPYGGAIARGLEKDDYSELEHLREEHGVYRLRITNEVDETQFTNLMELWVVDHPLGTQVAADERGNLHTLADLLAPISATDSDGHNLLPWLRATDRLIWEPESVPDAKDNLRGEIVMSFPKPAGATQAKLVANVATGLWGSYMIKEMVELHGRDVGAWLKLIDTNPAAVQDLFAWDLREELFALKIQVEEPTGWQVRGVLSGMGPFISKDRVVALDVSGVRGDKLHIRIRPPAGFWALNSFAVDYSPERATSVRIVRPVRARDADGKNVLQELQASDERYYSMPQTKDWADVTFPARPKSTGLNRAVFLHSRGYYQLHLRAEGEPNTTTLQEMNTVPGAAARFAANRFAQWKTARHEDR